MVEKGITDRNALPHSNRIGLGHVTFPGDGPWVSYVLATIAGLLASARALNKGGTNILVKDTPLQIEQQQCVREKDLGMSRTGTLRSVVE
jgi:hypothetical protein